MRLYGTPSGITLRDLHDAQLRDLREMQELVNAQSSARPDTLWLDESTYERLRNPFVPANLARVMTHGGGETYILTVNGECQTYTVPASTADALRGLNATARDAGAAIAHVASGNAAISPNPAPHGPTRRRRR